MIAHSTPFHPNNYSVGDYASRAATLPVSAPLRLPCTSSKPSQHVSSQLIATPAAGNCATPIGLVVEGMRERAHALLSCTPVHPQQDVVYVTAFNFIWTSFLRLQLRQTLS
jgi:hypothetical protein